MADDICAQRNGRPHLYTGIGSTATTCSACGQKHPDRVAAEAAVDTPKTEETQAP